MNNYFKYIASRLNQYVVNQKTMDVLMGIKDKRLGCIADDNSVVISMKYDTGIYEPMFLNRVTMENTRTISLYMDAKFPVRNMELYYEYDCSKIIGKLISKLQQHNYDYEFLKDEFAKKRSLNYIVAKYKIEIPLERDAELTYEKIIHIFTIFDTYNFKMFDVFRNKYETWLRERE